jgi:hypothetical protein
MAETTAPAKTDASGSATPGSAPAGDRVPIRMAAFIAGLLLALVAGFGLGRLIGTPPTGAASGGSGVPAADGHTHAAGTAPHAHPSTGATADRAAVGGLAVSASGYLLVPESASLTAGRAQPFRFTVIGPDRATVRTFAVVHDKPLHLIVVRRDLTGYQHLHPTIATNGTWNVPLSLPEPGAWRAYADFTATGPDGAQTAVTLGVDLTVAGDYRPRQLPPAARAAEVAGFAASYAGTPQVGATQPLLFTVTKAGALVALERYLGSYGHLVVLREGDLGYVHVHPEDQLAGGAVKFWLAAPSVGRYRMFFDFQVAGEVHTAQYTLVVT